MAFGVPMVWRVSSNHSTDSYFCMVPPIQNGLSMKKKINTCVSEYTISNSACASWRWTSFLFLNLQTILLYTLTMKTVFLQKAKNSSHQLQEMQTTCQAETPPIIRSQKARAMSSLGISNFQKIRHNFWHQG